MSPSVRLSFGLLLVAAMLSGCGVSLSSFGLGGVGGGTSLAEEEATGSTEATNVAVTRARPLDAYVVMGGRIKRCWFNATDPLLPNYVYRADVSPSGSKVTITVHQRADLGRAGLLTYIIDFKEAGSSTVITTENRTMPPGLAAKMQYDINRWQRGQADCSKTMPATAWAKAVKPQANAR
ncbi:hypothetical protein [Methyloceanibacter sp.]|uniref:hypothetical protein n=1 Tax=Methyloceanibacter sp. TaxID=1965321 RepID=UPI003D6C78EC